MQLQSDAVAAEGVRPVARVFADEGKGIARLDFETVEEVEVNGAHGDTVSMLRAEVAALQERLKQSADALPAKLDEARRMARLLARKDWEQELEQRTAEDRAMVLHACSEFAKERTRYFAAVEGQVVKLALAIAARVLHREARMDPLLLSGAVRVALEKVDEESEVKLRVPVNEVAMWSAELESVGARLVKVVGDAGMARGECLLESIVGTVELGIEAQLGEIERGFFDLMQRRPA